jgi:hypothetical protein
MARILPMRIYFRKVGFEILRYWMASSVVKTSSLSPKDIEFLLFMVILLDLKAKNMPVGRDIEILIAYVFETK